MNRILLDEPWAKRILPRGWPTATSTVLTGAGRSGKPLFGQVVAGSWLRSGGSVVFMPLQYPSHQFIVESMRRVPGVDVADHAGRVAFIELDAEMDGLTMESPRRIRANLVKPGIWDQALEIAAASVPADGPGLLVFGSALNLLLFSPTYGDAILAKMKRTLSTHGNRTLLFAVSNTAKATEMAELEDLADNLLISHSQRHPFRLYVRIVRMKGVRFRPDPVEIPIAPETLMAARAAAGRSRRRVMSRIADI